MPKTKEDKKECALESLKDLCRKNFSKKYGEDCIVSANELDSNISWLDVPDLGMQYAMGRPGFALGRIATIVGYEGSSKTSLALWIANLAIQQGGLAAMIETENAGSTEHMQSYVDTQKIEVYQPRSLEEGMEMSSDVLNMFKEIDPEGHLPKVLIFDSIAGSSLERELEEDREIGDEKVGGKGKFMSKAVEKIKPKLKENNCLWVVCNQGREYINTSAFGGPIPDMDRIVAAGGKAIPFAASYYIISKKGATIKSKDNELASRDGFTVKCQFKKNKLRTPFREFWYDVRWNQTLQFQAHTLELLTTGAVCGIKFESKKYWSPELGIEKKDGLDAQSMYEFLHRPPAIEALQRALDIRRNINPAEEAPCQASEA